MAGTTYQELLDGVEAYYGSGSDQWVNIARYGVNADTIPIIEQVPGVSITRSNSGAFLGFDYDNPFAGIGDPASIIDSNVQTGAYGQGSFNAQLPATAITNSSTGVTTMESGARAVSTGATLATIADKVSLAVAGVALGTKLGKLIDSALYNADPEWWDEHYPSINPETWDDIATTQGGKNLIRAIFGLQNDDTTMYLDERLLAQTYMMLLANGAYGSGLPVNEGDVTPGSNYRFTTQLLNARSYTWPASVPFTYYEGSEFAFSNTSYSVVLVASSPVKFFNIRTNNGPLALSLNGPFTLTTTTKNSRGSVVSWASGTRTATTSSVSVGSNTIQYWYAEASNQGLALDGCNIPITGEKETGSRTYPDLSDDLAVILTYGNIVTPSSTPGIEDNPEAHTYIDPNLITGTTPEQVLEQLKQNYPDLFDNPVYQDIPQPDGTTQRITYIPVPYPDTTNTAQPITDTTPGINPQTNPQVNPNTRTEELLQQITNSLTTDTTPPDTGEGNTPPAVIPTGSANALYSIYNPTQGELNSFGAWLWSSNFVDQLLKLFNDPMQAIIGLHKVFAPPVISDTSTIKVGYLDSGVPSNVVGNQYTTIDCGTVNVSEYFGNVFDYDPFTQIYIYLPFIGIEKLDTGDVMRGVIGVKYHVDVLTGACLAEITVTRDGAGGIIYTFAGNCAVQYPISSGSYMGIVASLASIAGGVVGTIASGGAIAPVAMGAVGGVMNAHTRVNHSGAFSGNAGAMGVKKPYLIITRPQTCLADDFPAYDGYPANKTTTLSDCSGFVKCETCHIENVPATDEELSEIESLLKNGVLI